MKDFVPCGSFVWLVLSSSTRVDKSSKVQQETPSWRLPMLNYFEITRFNISGCARILTRYSSLCVEKHPFSSKKLSTRTGPGKSWRLVFCASAGKHHFERKLLHFQTMLLAAWQRLLAAFRRLSFARPAQCMNTIIPRHSPHSSAYDWRPAAPPRRHWESVHNLRSEPHIPQCWAIDSKFGRWYIWKALHVFQLKKTSKHTFFSENYAKSIFTLWKTFASKVLVDISGSTSILKHM